MKRAIIFNFVLLFFTAFYLMLSINMLLSGNLLSLFHPRNYLFFLISVFLFLLMFYRQICNLVNRKYIQGINVSVLVFLLPLLAYTAAFSNKWNMQEIIRRQSSIIPVAPRPQLPQNKKNDIINTDFLILTDENYFQLYNEISANLDEVVGKNIEVSGYVFREENYKKTEIVAARDLMWCCAADIAVIGFYCEIDNPDNFDENCWVKVKGRLEKHLYHNFDSDKEYYIPSVKVESIEKINPPENSYIYPF